MNRKTIRILMLLLVAMGLGIGEAKAETVDHVMYIDADGQTKYKDGVTVLTGTEPELGLTTMGEYWYVTTSQTATFNRTITLHPGVHIILADGTTMTVPLGFYGTADSGDIINIYSQGGTDEGKLTINITDPTTNSGSALLIAGGYITINGGIINITAVNDGIRGGG